MTESWLHLSELGGDPWVLPIWTAAHKAVQSGKTTPIPPEIYSLGLHLSMRLNILPRVVDRVNSNTLQLYDQSKQYGPEYLTTKAQEGYACPIDNDLKYSLIADIDGLLFELNATCAMMTRLFGLLHSHVRYPIAEKQLGKSIGVVVAQGGQDIGWFALLDKHRNFFMHEGTPYLAIDMTNAPDRLDLLIMKENIKTFTDPETFVALSEINSIVQGFMRARSVLQKYLVSLFEKERALTTA